MKTLKDHIVLFDAECPMCNAYTQAFVKSGMLPANGRAPYQNQLDTICPLIDRQRAVNEIALVNLQNGQVSYGIESIFKILGNSWPVFNPLFVFGPFVWLMRKLYAFISYNRRVIIPASLAGDGFIYQPTFKKHYRIAYLLFTWFFTGCILTAYAKLLAGTVPLGNAYREYLICGGQICFLAMMISMIAKEKLWNYLGNMMTISFAGSLLLLFPLGLKYFMHLSPISATLYFLCVAGLMLFEHIRRSNLLLLGWKMTISWVAYRVIILLFIIL